MQLYVINSSICLGVLTMTLSSTRITHMYWFLKIFYIFIIASQQINIKQYISESDLHFAPIDFIFLIQEQIYYAFYSFEINQNHTCLIHSSLSGSW